MSPQVRALVPLDGPEGPVGLNEVIDVSDGLAALWRAQGKVSLIEDEERLAAVPGHYSDVTGRDDVAGPPSGELPGPQAAEEQDEPKGKKGKK